MALLTLLAAILLLVLVGHVSSEGLLVACNAVVTLYGAWNGSRAVPDRRRESVVGPPPERQRQLYT